MSGAVWRLCVAAERKRLELAGDTSSSVWPHLVGVSATAVEPVENSNHKRMRKRDTIFCSSLQLLESDSHSKRPLGELARWAPVGGLHTCLARLSFARRSYLPVGKQASFTLGEEEIL